FDPAVGGWTEIAPMKFRRANHTATVLPGGNVLVAGGADTGSTAAYQALCSAEIYDVAAGKWKVTGGMGGRRVGHVATLLADGNVLIAGGFGGADSLASCEIYNPQTGATALTGAMRAARVFHSATMLEDGTVLVAGGVNGSAFHLAGEVYDPVKQSWSDAG